MAKVNRWRCVLEGYQPPAPNRTGGCHWARLLKIKKTAADYVVAFGAPLPSFRGPVRLRLIREWGKRQRALDPDNLVASMKFLIDVLRAPLRQNELGRRLGVIQDDRPDNFIGGEPEILQRKSSDGLRRTIIEIEVPP